MPISAEKLVKVFPFLILGRNIVNSIEESAFFLKAQFKKNYRKFFKTADLDIPSSPLAILCVKKTIYARMAIRNLNSLHYLNPNYKFILYCDQVCYDYFKKNWPQIDYPKSVKLELEFRDKPEEIWQSKRLKVIELITEKNGAIVDADSRWFGFPPTQKNTVYFLAPSHLFKDNPDEAALLKAALPKKNWEYMTHYASGFLYIPKKYGTKKLFIKISSLQDTLVRTIQKKKLSPHLLRLVDEIALNVVLQEEVGEDKVKPLKKVEGPGNRHILLSYYYGCWSGEVH